MGVAGVHPPDPDDPRGMAFVLAAGFPDPRPGGYPNQQLVIVQAWEAASQLWYDLGLRYHPELATKWVVGGGQFSCGEIVDKPPVEKTLAENAEDMLADLGNVDPKFAEMLKKIKSSGSEDEKKALVGELENNIKGLAKLIEFMGNQQ